MKFNILTFLLFTVTIFQNTKPNNTKTLCSLVEEINLTIRHPELQQFDHFTLQIDKVKNRCLQTDTKTSATVERILSFLAQKILPETSYLTNITDSDKEKFVVKNIKLLREMERSLEFLKQNNELLENRDLRFTLKPIILSKMLFLKYLIELCEDISYLKLQDNQASTGRLNNIKEQLNLPKIVRIHKNTNVPRNKFFKFKFFEIHELEKIGTEWSNPFFIALLSFHRFVNYLYGASLTPEKKREIMFIDPAILGFFCQILSELEAQPVENIDKYSLDLELQNIEKKLFSRELDEDAIENEEEWELALTKEADPQDIVQPNCITHLHTLLLGHERRQRPKKSGFLWGTVIGYWLK